MTPDLPFANGTSPLSEPTTFTLLVMRCLLLAAGALIVGVVPGCSSGSDLPARNGGSTDVAKILESAPSVTTFRPHVTKALSSSPSVVDIQDALYNLKLNGYSVRISGSAHHRAFQELSLGPDLFVRRQGAVDWAHIVRPPAYFPRVRTEQPGLLFIPAVQKAAITVVGHTTVGGQPTTHYRAVEPYSTYLEAEGLQTTTSGGSVTTDLFLDGHGLPWRVAQSLPAAGSTLRTVRVYSAYRSTVALRPPPASRVIGSVTVRDQTELASELGKATGER